jgi:hypothetical protein
MIREQITVEDYHRISKENEYYLWHFVRKNDTGPLPLIHTIFGDDSKINHLKPLLEIFDIPYYESYIEDSLNFLDVLGVPLNFLYIKDVKKFDTFILSFNKKRMVNATFYGYCMCTEGITDLIYNLNPEFIEKLNLD